MYQVNVKDVQRGTTDNYTRLESAARAFADECGGEDIDGTDSRVGAWEEVAEDYEALGELVVTIPELHYRASLT